MMVHPRRLSGTRLAIGLLAMLVAWQITALIGAVLAEVQNDDLAVAILLGVNFAQVSLAAAWIAFGTQNFSVRSLGSVLLVALNALTSFLMFQLVEGNVPIWAIMVLGAAFLTQWCAVQLPLWVARLGFGWRVENLATRDTEVTHHSDVQFGIRQLMAWTTATAVLLGVGRLLYLQDSRSNSGDIATALLLFGLFAVFHTLLSLPVIWAGLTRDRFVLWAMISIVYTVAITMVEPLVFAQTPSRPPFHAWFWWLLNGWFFTVLFGSLLVLRWCGYQLVQRLPAAAAAEQAGSASERSRDHGRSQQGPLQS